ncbi:MFS transporter [Bryobacterales bacterium F-183]|nr:MFS transporter [Bryobacterales bacterium F-183]
MRRLTGTEWAICAVAAIGFAFDIYELLMLPLIARPALMELGGLKPGTPEFNNWLSLLFWIPALAGGFFGLIGGYLTDRYGRRRVLTFSILLYSVSAFAAGFATSLNQLLFLRSTTFIGVCVEFVAAVAWLAELFDDPKQREAVLGYTQAFSSIGGLLVAGANALCIQLGPSFPAIYGGHAEWRYTLMSGLIPALPLLIIRPFLPESPKWLERKLAGTLRRPSVGELFSPELRKTTLVTTAMFACAYGAAFGAIQQLPQIIPGLPGVAELPRPKQQEVTAGVQSLQEIGGLVGRALLAVLAVRVASRRTLLRIFQVPGLFVVPVVFAVFATSSLDLTKIGIFFAGLFTVAQFSFWGNYLPMAFPLHLRGTGEGFAANVGGRMIGTGFAAVTAQLAPMMGAGSAPANYAQAAAWVAAFVYLGGLLLSTQLPEQRQEFLEKP